MNFFILYMAQVLFAGDSTMMFLFKATPSSKINGCKKIIGTRCNFLEFVHQNRSKRWSAPTSLEGPTKYGLTHPYCSDCKGCEPMAYNCKDSKSNLYYLPVEYTRDVEHPTLYTKTTQESVALYLKSNPMEGCVINVGLHDMKLKLSSRQYVSRVVMWLESIRPYCKTLVWVSLNSVQESPVAKGALYIHPQYNRVIRVWNNKLYNKLKTVDFLDVYNLSTHMRHRDNVHMEPTYYKVVNELVFSKLLVKKALSNKELGKSSKNSKLNYRCT